MIGTKIILFLMSVILCVFLLITDVRPQYLENIWQIVNFGAYIGNTNIWCRDIDGDQTEEIIFGDGGYENHFFMILKYINNDYITTWTSEWFDANDISLLEIANLDSDSDYEIYVIMTNGQIKVYDGSTMTIVDTFQTQATRANGCSIADVDNDGDTEFTIIGSDYLRIYNAKTFHQEWSSTAFNGEDIEVGDVDHDGFNEIILADGRVLNGASHQIEWSYSGGFGREIELADIDQDSILEIIGLSRWENVIAVDGELHTPIWQFNVGNHQALCITDIECDDKLELLIGTEYDLYCYDALTAQKLWYIENPENGVTNISLGDPDADGIKEVIWGAGQSTSGPDYLFIASTQNKNIEWQSLDLEGPFSVAIYDVDNDETNEIIVACNSYSRGVALVYDGLSHSVEWFSNEISTFYGGINCITVANINKTDQGEIIIGAGSQLLVLDGLSYNQLWESLPGNVVNVVEVADVDADHVMEIIIGDNSGYITIYNGETFQREWQSISMGKGIAGIKITNCDQDKSPEIIFFTASGIIQIYDGITHFLEWQGSTITKVTALDVNDFDLDGIKEIIAGDYNGNLTIIDCITHKIDTVFSVANEKISGLKVANLDSSRAKELLIGTSTLKVLNTEDFLVKWESASLGDNIGNFDNLHVVDIDNDQLMDVFLGGSWGVFQLESTTPYSDITPPMVLTHFPTNGSQFVSIDADIRAIFSESISAKTLNNKNFIVTNESGDTINATISYDDKTLTVTAVPDNYLPTNTLLTAILKGDITDLSGNGLDGNKNGIFEGSPFDDFIWSFTTGVSLDTVGPSIKNVIVASDSVWRGLDIRINAVVTDSSSIAASLITYVECFLDIMGSSGTGIPFEPEDREFDATIEKVVLTLDTGNLMPGDHTLYIHGKDAKDNWGEFKDVTFHIIQELASNWPMFGQNAQHTGYNENDSIVVPLQLKWQVEVSKQPLNQVAVANDCIFVTHQINFQEAFLRALQAKDGAEMWNHSFGDIFSINPPSVAYGYVYVQTGKGSGASPYLTALNVFTAEIVWQSNFKAQWERYLAPTIYKGKVFVNGGYYGGMYAYDAFTGQELWFKSLNQYDQWTPAVYKDIAYAYVGENVAGGNSQLVAVDINTGSTIWEKYDIPFSWSGWSMGTAPVIDAKNDIILVSSSDYLHAVDLNTQKILWHKWGGSITPAVYNDLVLVVGGILTVYDIKTGQELWSFNGDNGLSYPPVISNGYVFVSSDTSTFAVNIQTRQEAWSYKAGGHLTIANNHLYIATKSGELYAFKKAPSQVADHNGYDVPTYYALYQNYPNPFNPSTTIQYTLPKSSHVELKVYNLLGKEVEILVDHNQTPGNYDIEWHPQNLPSGIYFYQLKAGDFIEKKKAILMK